MEANQIKIVAKTSKGSGRFLYPQANKLACDSFTYVVEIPSFFDKL